MPVNCILLAHEPCIQWKSSTLTLTLCCFISFLTDEEEQVGKKRKHKTGKDLPTKKSKLEPSPKVSRKLFLSPPVQIARWAHMHHFLSVVCSLSGLDRNGRK